MCKDYRERHSKCNHVSGTEVRTCQDNCRPEAENYHVYVLNSPTYCPSCMLNLDSPPTDHSNLPDIDFTRHGMMEELLDLWERHKEHIRAHPHGQLSMHPNDIYAFQEMPPLETHEWLKDIKRRMECTLHARWAIDEASNPTHEEIMLFLRLRAVLNRSSIRLMEDNMFLNMLRNLAQENPADRLRSARAILMPVQLGSLRQDEMNCNVCWNRFGEDIVEEGEPTIPAEYPARLPCGHVFGQRCAERFLQEQQRNCPLCRRDFGLRARRERRHEIYEMASQTIGQRYIDMPTPWWLSMLQGNPLPYYEDN